MTQTEISVQRALSELNMLDKRIERKIFEATFIGAKKGKKLVKNFADENELTEKVKASLQSIQELISRRNNIKTAIVQSNAVTKVNISDKTYTVAEAIERKSSIDYEKTLLNKMKQQYSQFVNFVEDSNTELEDSIERQINQMLSSDSKKDDNLVKSITSSLKEENEAKLIDPIGLKDKIEELEEQIEEFESEVDHVLVESNTITKITV